MQDELPRPSSHDGRRPSTEEELPTKDLIAQLPTDERDAIRRKAEQIILLSPTGGWSELREGLQDQKMAIRAIRDEPPVPDIFWDE